MSTIILSGPEFEDVNYGELKKFVEGLGFKVKIEKDFLLKANPEIFAERMARIRVLDPDKEELNQNPFPLEIDYERKNILRDRRKKGVIYSGNHFLRILQDLIFDRLDIEREWIIYFSDQLLATFEARWHIRVIILGVPVIISLPGIVYGPARSREYYVLKGIGINEVEGDYIKENDLRKTEVLKGYILQAIYFYKCLIKNKKFEFCEDRNCSLYNSHWQKEIFNAQLRHSLCEKHIKEFKI